MRVVLSLVVVLVVALSAVGAVPLPGRSSKPKPKEPVQLYRKDGPERTPPPRPGQQPAAAQPAAAAPAAPGNPNAGCAGSAADWKQNAVLGQGGSSDVYHASCLSQPACDKTKNKRLVMKTMKANQKIQDFCKESKMAIDIGNKCPAHVVRTFDAFIASNKASIIIELMPNGDLNSKGARGDKPRPFTQPAQLKKAWAEMVDAVACLNNAGYIHRDIKPEQFLVAPDRSVKLADFGASVSKDEVLRSLTAGPFIPFHGTERYGAQLRRVNKNAAGVWSPSVRRADSWDIRVMFEARALGWSLWEVWMDELFINHLDKCEQFIQINKGTTAPSFYDSLAKPASAFNFAEWLAALPDADGIGYFSMWNTKVAQALGVPPLDNDQNRLLFDLIVLKKTAAQSVTVARALGGAARGRANSQLPAVAAAGANLAANAAAAAAANPRGGAPPAAANPRAAGAPAAGARPPLARTQSQQMPARNAAPAAARPAAGAR